jgi:protein involved in polysaccharide export with SLBB domain
MKHPLLVLALLLIRLAIPAMAQQQDQPANTISVVGEVTLPGVYSLRPNRTLTISQAIALAKGFTKSAYKKKVEITRNGAPDKITVDLAAVLAGKVPDVPLQAGDVVRVP